MKKIYLVGIVSVFLLTGCAQVGSGYTLTEYEIDSESGTITETNLSTEKDNSERNADYLEQVASIEVVDVMEGQYREELHIILSPEEVEALKAIGDDLKPSYESWEGFGSFLYKLNMYDADGNYIACWNVPLAYYVTDSNGQCLEENEVLKEWIDGIEDSHDIISKLYDRTPGANYFKDIATVQKGHGTESVDYYDGVEYVHFDLDEEDIQSLRLLADIMCVISGPQMSLSDMDHMYDNLYYDLCVLTEVGDSYTFYVAYDGTIYMQTKDTFVVTGEGVEEWFRALEAKYGLIKIEQ